MSDYVGNKDTEFTVQFYLFSVQRFAKRHCKH